ncbi:hypothetical protein [Spiroplasma endosymbiont of Labia minor]|uniref:hypothetical protein n=1 Tax=Spiroplasma endosymbiont of Labia minor TaxID=3066305 RepID=UPI0030D60D60
MPKRTKIEIIENNNEYQENQKEFLKESVIELSELFTKLDFAIIWQRNDDIYDKYYPLIDLIFSIKINSKSLIFYVVLKSGKLHKYEFARDRKIDGKEFHSLRVDHPTFTRKYDQSSCKQLINVLNFNDGLNKNYNLKFGYIKTINYVDNNPTNRESAVYYRNENIILGNKENLIKYINELSLNIN